MKKVKQNKGSISLNEYQKLAKRTKGQFKTKSDELSDYGLGVSGEAGDLAGCIKKTLFQDNDQKAGIRENIGDTMWYLAMICNFFGWSLNDVLSENIEKLRKRYPKGFSFKNARRKGTRVDWNEK